MKTVILSHKLCWRSGQSPTGFATDGGFPFQIEYISKLFDETIVLVPENKGDQKGLLPVMGKNVTVIPLSGFGLNYFDYRRKLLFPFWLLLSFPRIFWYVINSESVHTPLPSDVGLIGTILAKIFNKPLFIRYGANWIDDDNAGFNANLIGRFSKWFINSFTGGKTVSFVTGDGEQKPSRNPNVQWIFSTTLKASEIERCHKFIHPLEPGKLRIAFVGRLEKPKGVDKVVRSLALIKEQIPAAELVIIGEGPFKHEISEIIREMDLQDSVFLPGRLKHDDVISELGKADLFCFPSVTEGFPKVVVEAMACGLPVVASNVSVLPYLVGSDCGRILKVGTPENIAEAVMDCVHDPRVYTQLSHKAVEKVSKYSLENWINIIGSELKEKWNKPINLVR